MHMLVDLKDMEIKKLSEIYDVESRDSFVSLYINMEKTNEKLIEKYLGMNDREDGQKGLAIFASNEHDFFKAYKLGVPVEVLSEQVQISSSLMITRYCTSSAALVACFASRFHKLKSIDAPLVEAARTDYALR